MATKQETKKAYRTQPIEQFIGRLAGATVWQRTSLSSFVAGGIILFLTMYSVLIRTEISPDPLVVELRHFGSVDAAIERIRDDHFISIRELDELSDDSSLNPYDRLAYEHSPLILDDSLDQRLENLDDVPIGVYYTYSVTTYSDREVVHIEYWMYFSDENMGMSAPERMARWGHALDRELIYRLNILNGEVFGAEYQAPIHELTRFQYPEGGRPIFRIASGNHNFQIVHGVDRRQIPDATNLLAPRPQYDLAASPLVDMDIMAMAAHEALLQNDVDMRRYVYVGIEDPAYVSREPYPAEVDVGVMTEGRWSYLHSTIGHGVVVWGYRLVAIDVGFAPTQGDIEELTLFVRSTEPGDRPELRVARVFIYPDLRIPA